MTKKEKQNKKDFYENRIVISKITENGISKGDKLRVISVQFKQIYPNEFFVYVENLRNGKKSFN